MAEFNPSDLLPMFPWEGPPLPRFMGVTWSVQATAILASAVGLALSVVMAVSSPKSEEAK